MNKEELRLKWKAQIDDFIKSGQSMSKYSKDKDINYYQLKYWFV